MITIDGHESNFKVKNFINLEELLVKITDDNMLTEYRCTHCWVPGNQTWRALFARCGK